MTGELDYLEKYSVAPAPSRDYYGIRILRDEESSFLGKAILDNVADFATGKTKNSEDNSSSVDRGWTRVFKEGQAMQRTSKIAQTEKKKSVKSRGHSTGVKSTVATKSRVKSSKTPLEVIKSNNSSLGKNLQNSSTLKSTSGGNSGTSRRVVEVSEKITRMKVTRVTEEAGKSDKRISANVDKTRQEKKILAPSKSTILRTDKSLMAGSSSVTKKNVDLNDLIREEAKKHQERTSIERSAGDRRKSGEDDSSSGNYEIENPWSSNSSIDTVSSPNDAIKKSLQGERSFLTDKYKSAKVSMIKDCSKVKKNASENQINNNPVESSAANKLDNINRLATLGSRHKKHGFLQAKQATSELAKIPTASMKKKTSNHTMDIDELRKE